MHNKIPPASNPGPLKVRPHSPAPWYVLADPLLKHPYHARRYVVTDPEVYTYVDSDGARSWTFEDPKASIICTLTDHQYQAGNAALIAAAPALLAALERVEASLRNIYENSIIDLLPEDVAALDLAQLARAKARGLVGQEGGQS